MKIKTELEFTSFSDGVCNIYSEDDDGNKTYKYNNLGFTNRILGFKRYFNAAANQVNINRVIRIPDLKDIDNYDYIEIDKIKYGVKMVQKIDTSNPPSIDLTLDKAR